MASLSDMSNHCWNRAQLFVVYYYRFCS